MPRYSLLYRTSSFADSTIRSSFANLYCQYGNAFVRIRNIILFRANNESALYSPFREVVKGLNGFHVVALSYADEEFARCRLAKCRRTEVGWLESGESRAEAKAEINVAIQMQIRCTDIFN